MINIYVLGLRQNKYYIGKTNKLYFRIKEHFRATGSNWTKIYKPVKVVEIIKNCDSFDEDKYTLQYMNKYGIENVRGGSFCNIELSKSETEVINKMIKGSTDKCYNCGESGHYASNCKKYGKKGHIKYEYNATPILYKE